VYQKADVLLLTSLWETGPIVAWEAMAHGVVVVTSRYIGSRREGALQHGENCLAFETGDTDTAAELLQELSANPDLWHQLSRGGRRLVEDRYSLEGSVARWDEVLSEIARQELRPLAAPPLVPSRNRLTRLLGHLWAERVRSLRSTLPPDGGPGGEWPHALTGGAHGDVEFWARAARRDRGANEGAAALLEACGH
jgi:hypothetical protein